MWAFCGVVTGPTSVGQGGNVAKSGLSKQAVAIIAIVAGILILVLPGLMQWVVGIFLIVWGALALMGKT